MFEVKLYVYVDALDPHKSKKEYTYCLECNGKKLKGSGIAYETWHGAQLEAMVKGLGRLTENCTVTIYSEDKWVLNMINHELQKWSENGFKNYKGDEIANAEKWRKIQQRSRSARLLTCAVEPHDKDYLISQCEVTT